MSSLCLYSESKESERKTSKSTRARLVGLKNINFSIEYIKFQTKKCLHCKQTPVILDPNFWLNYKTRFACTNLRLRFSTAVDRRPSDLSRIVARKTFGDRLRSCLNRIFRSSSDRVGQALGKYLAILWQSFGIFSLASLNSFIRP